MPNESPRAPAALPTMDTETIPPAPAEATQVDLEVPNEVQPDEEPEPVTARP